MDLPFRSNNFSKHEISDMIDSFGNFYLQTKIWKTIMFVRNFVTNFTIGSSRKHWKKKLSLDNGEKNQIWLEKTLYTCTQLKNSHSSPKNISLYIFIFFVQIINCSTSKPSNLSKQDRTKNKAFLCRIGMQSIIDGKVHYGTGGGINTASVFS